MAFETIAMFSDFTYIDNIVESVKHVIEHSLKRENGMDGLSVPAYKIYNIGNLHPENLLNFVDILQQELVQAKVLLEDYDFDKHKELVPIQAGDVSVTYADFCTGTGLYQRFVSK